MHKTSALGARGMRAGGKPVRGENAAMATVRELKAVSPQPGRPLYLTVRDVVREAIDSGLFSPGEQMPSTKELSEQMEVSLVTTHRALQELVASGVLQRSQGKGTFVHQRHFAPKRSHSAHRP